MNTAPKLQTIIAELHLEATTPYAAQICFAPRLKKWAEQLEQIDAPFRNMTDQATFDEYRNQLAAGNLTPVDQIAFDNILHNALAPPSGEGVELDHVRQRIELAIEHGDAHGWATARNELAGVLGSSYFTTPQSAPVDGTPSSRWVANGEPDPHGTHYDCERAKLAGGEMTDDEVANEMYLHPSIVNLTIAKDRIRWLSRALTAALTTPPPASQESGGERSVQTISMHRGDELTVRRSDGWDEHRIIWNAKPPSSAADLTRHNPIALPPPEKELQRQQFAAEQAKPVGCSHCWGDRWMKDGTPCPACNSSGRSGHAHAEQAQAGEWTPDMIELRDSLRRLLQSTYEAGKRGNGWSNQGIELEDILDAAFSSRLAGGVTVDKDGR